MKDVYYYKGSKNLIRKITKRIIQLYKDLQTCGQAFFDRLDQQQYL